MQKKIQILLDKVKVEAELNASETAGSIWEALPIEGKANLWGEEIYFSVPVKAVQEEGAREVVSAGELGYWPPGNAFCIFFGPTPASRGNEIRAASAVNIIGRVSGDPGVFRQAKDGAKVILEKLSPSKAHGFEL